MDPAHEGRSTDPVDILIDPVLGPGLWRGSKDQGSMFCSFPLTAWLCEQSGQAKAKVIQAHCVCHVTSFTSCT